MATQFPKNDPEQRAPRLGVVGPAPQPAPIEIDPTADDGVDLAQLWGTLQDNLRFVVGVAAVLFCTVMFATMMSRMSFRSSGRLYLGELETKAKSAANSSGDLDFSGGGQGDVSSEIEIIKSQSLVTQAILASGLNVEISPHGWKRPRFWQWLVGGRNPHTLDVPAQELAAVNTAIADNSRGALRYVANFTSDTGYELSAGGKVLGKGRLGLPLAVEGLTITLIPGSERAPVNGATYDVTVNALDATTDAVLSALTVAAPKAIGTGEAAKVVTLEFFHTSPFASASFLRKLMMGYLGERQAWKTEDASAAETFVTDQLRSLRDSLDRTEQKLADYRSTHRVVVLDNEAKAMIEQIGKYEEQRVAARLEVASLNDMKRVLKTANPTTEAFLFGEAKDTVLEDLSQQLSESRNLLSEAEIQFGKASPQANQQRIQVEGRLEMIRGYVNSRTARAQENLTAMNGIIGQFEEKLKTVPGAELGLAQLGRESEVYSRVYSYMLERQQQAAITKASTVSKNRILDFPQMPYREDGPKLGLRLASGPLALVFGAILVLLSRYLSVAFQSDGEIRRVVGGLPLLGNLPRRPKARKMKEAEMDVPEFAAAASDPASAYSEALRVLRANLMLSQLGTERARVVTFTSPVPGDGKTTTVMSLAATLARDGKRVLLVDADMRKPSHHKIAGYSNELGLRSVLSGLSAWQDVVHRIQVGSGSLDSIGAGKMAPAELLSSERVSRFLTDAREHYDYILLDAPSFPLVSDPIVLATVSDTVISVFRMRHTPRRVAVEHVRRLAPSAPSYALVINDSTIAGVVYGTREKNEWLERILSWFSRVTQGVLFSRWLMIWSVLCAISIAAAGVFMLLREPVGNPTRMANPDAPLGIALPPENREPAPPLNLNAASGNNSAPAPAAVQAPVATQPAGTPEPGRLPAPLPKWWELEKTGRMLPQATQTSPAPADATRLGERPRATSKAATNERARAGWVTGGGESGTIRPTTPVVPLPENPYQ
jgi:tyrosine-protein kinase Etk/Wzc